MIIGHELGHIRARYLRWLRFVIPGMGVPFLGSLYSQAR
jgi:Zn-dependent protease with chaperone function